MADKITGQRHDRSALVLYGTETGNSQEVAEELGRVFERLHFTTSVGEMDDVEINVLLRSTVVIFAISTTGQGEFPKNARKFWKSLLRKRLPPNCLGHVDFTTFGLGDSSYPKFNWTARKLHKRLQQLGAKEVYPRGEADDQHNEGLDGAFLPWKADLTKHLLTLYPLPEGKVQIPISQPLPPKFLLKFLPLPTPTPTPPAILPEVARSGEQEASRLEQQLDLSTKSPRRDANSNSNGNGNDNSHVLQSEVQPLTTPNLALSTSTLSLPTSSTFQPYLPDTDLHPHNTISNKDLGMTTNMKMPPPEIPVSDPPAFCQQVKEPHPDLETPVDKDLPHIGLLPILGGRTAELISNKRVTPATHWQDVRLLTFTVDDRIRWSPGDVLTIFPKNFPEDVQALIDLQGWQFVADTPLVIERTSTESEVITCIPHALIAMIEDTMELGTKVTLRDLLTNYLDITSIPKRFFLQTMSFFTEDEMHQERLQEFCNPAYTDEFFDYTTRPRRSILEVLADFPSVRIPWNQAAHLFPIMRPRQYSIATGGAESRYDYIPGLKKLDILVAMVKYKTVLKKIRQGVCSRYLSSLAEGTQIKVRIERPSEMFYHIPPREPQRHLLMIAAGTGIAPCRALIWERAELRHRNKHEKIGAHMLIYGGRNKKADFFFEKEWERQILQTDVLTAFSRDQKEKIYVQDIIRKQSQDIYEAFEKGFIVYVCGSAGAMPKAVREAFVDVLVEYTSVGDGTERDLDAIRAEAIKKLDDMVKKGTYVEETW